MATKKPNTIVIYKDFAEIILENKNSEEVGKALIDVEDVMAIRNFRWCLNSYNQVVTNIDGKTICLNRFLTNPEKGMLVNFISRDKLDYRKNNLVVCTMSEQMINNDIRSNNSSGEKGVCWSKAERKWKAHICVNNKQIRLGSYDLFEDAVQARKQAEKKYFSQYIFR